MVGSSFCCVESSLCRAVLRGAQCARSGFAGCRDLGRSCTDAAMASCPPEAPSCETLDLRSREDGGASPAPL